MNIDVETNGSNRDDEEKPACGTEGAVTHGKTVHLHKGEIMTFRAEGTYHKGVSITSGMRYILVGFVHVTDSTPM